MSNVNKIIGTFKNTIRKLRTEQTRLLAVSDSSNVEAVLLAARSQEAARESARAGVIATKLEDIFNG